MDLGGLCVNDVLELVRYTNERGVNDTGGGLPEPGARTVPVVVIPPTHVSWLVRGDPF